MPNPMDQLEVVRDLIRKEECEFLFNSVRVEEKTIDPDTLSGGYRDGYYAGLNFVLDLLDVRIGHLRDKWTDAV